MTTGSYLKLLQCVQDSVGSQLISKDVAWRCKLKRYGLSNQEAKVAMSPNVFDILTVIDPSKIAVQGIAWVKSKIRQTCEAKGMVYFRHKWRQFSRYFQGTWMDTYPPTFWNVFDMSRVSRANRVVPS
ncbi:hypothetical protein PC118_g7278 [Phytophthora cactorum]|uniref:Uncharacterized protein n=1 Tax=Phytophthora cactorum TaxID=29920 RepID=A0A8T1GF11_9STRA|nr:hypothetical protein PC112_g13886 [Phytophthora cactorum]KAG2817212.1 hypothetical protein PC111_g12792 [Phytophthora cactorum]KAG2853407.1 hypothetical protein PC113_g14195 [Phytophthora cactorum]KAG2896360.1 hypothetical protein PC114_g15107 [Phytophthora cactorum]KAG2987435.1 hypothetical protein PC118_g7278 [Phytophthora cactorum]